MPGKSVRKEDTTNPVEAFPAAGDGTAEGFKERREGVLPHVRVNDLFISKKKKKLHVHRFNSLCLLCLDNDPPTSQ